MAALNSCFEVINEASSSMPTPRRVKLEYIQHRHEVTNKMAK